MQLLIAPIVPCGPRFFAAHYISYLLRYIVFLSLLFCIWSPIRLEMKGSSLDFQDGIKVMCNLSCPFSFPIDDRHPRFLQIDPLRLRSICLSPSSCSRTSVYVVLCMSVRTPTLASPNGWLKELAGAIHCGHLPWPLMNTNALRMCGTNYINNFDVYSSPNSPYIIAVCNKDGDAAFLGPNQKFENPSR